MSRSQTPAGSGPRLGIRQVRVLGRVVDGDVTRDDAFVYRVQDTATDVDDLVYELEDLALVDLLPDGRVAPTAAGRKVWQKRRPKRPSSPEGLSPEFTAAGRGRQP